MKKMTLTPIWIIALLLVFLAVQAPAQDSRTGLFSHTPVQLSNPAAERISSVLAEPPSPADISELTPEGLIGMFDSWASLDGTLGVNPALEMIKAMLEDSDEEPRQPSEPTPNPAEPFGGWNPLLIQWGESHNLWFGNVNSATPSEPQ